MRIKGFIVLRLLFIGALLLFCVSLVQSQAILQPEQDVVVVTFGGGEGWNVFAKYNITTVPAGEIIDSVFLTPYVVAVGDSWDGDVFLWNVNDQDWTEGDSCNHIYGLPTSDQVTQTSGFGTTTGWGRSTDLTDIFLVDYNAARTYCSIKIKDPDDMTSVPMPGSMPINAETLAVGNIIFNEHTIFYAREYPNAPPWLTVYYHSVGVDEALQKSRDVTMTLTPNPSKDQVRIRFSTDYWKTMGDLCIYDINGVRIREFTCHANNTAHTIIWDGRDEKNRLVPSGTYFCVATGEGYRTVEPVCIIR